MAHIAARPPAVSLLIPAYNPRFFREALHSAAAQSFRDLEIHVLDDSPDGSIEAISRECRDRRLVYHRNAGNLGFFGNFNACFEAARGEYIKLLNDDDWLQPHCIETQHAAFGRYGDGIVLVTGKRRIIDENGRYGQDIAATLTLAHVPARLNGVDLGNFVLVNSTNFIGEPSTVLWRKAALQPLGETLFAWEGRRYHCLADLSVWLRLLAHGDAVYLPEPLSCYRLHGGQQQQQRDVSLACYSERVPLLATARRAGFLAAEGDWEMARNRVKAMLEQPLPHLAGAEREAIEAALAELARL